MYTITDDALTYGVMPMFSVSPSFCAATFTLSSSTEIDGLITYDEAT